MAKDTFQEIKQSPHTKVQVHESDPAVIAGVQEFLAAHQGSESAEEEKKRTVVQPDDELLAETPTQAFLKEAFVPVENIEVTEEEMRIYLKTLMTDEPTRFTVSLFNRQLKCEMRTRTTHEQRRVFDVLNYQVKQSQLESPEVNYAFYMTLLQQYFALLMVERINGNVFSELTLPSDYGVEQCCKALCETHAKLFPMNNIRWAAILNAMRIFEAKCAKMSENAANEDFWKPRR